MTRVSRRACALLPAALFIAAIAPEANAQDLDLGAYKGRVVYLDFWASWCTPCRLSFPWMNELQQTEGQKGLVVIGVNVDHERPLADQFLKQTPALFKVIYDPGGRIAQKYDVKDMPTSILIGRDGKVRYIHSGFNLNREGEYLAHLNALLSAGG